MNKNVIKVIRKVAAGGVAALVMLLLISFLPLEKPMFPEESGAAEAPKSSQEIAYSQNTPAATDKEEDVGLQEHGTAEIALQPGEIVTPQPKVKPRKEQPEATVPRPEIIEPVLANQIKVEGVEGKEKEVEVLIRIADSEAEGAAGVLAITASRIDSERAMMEEAAEELEKAGAKVEGTYPIGNIIVAKVKVSELEQITANKKVEMISANREVQAVLSESVPQIEAQAFWNAGFKGKGVKIAILDTGIDASHPMLAGKVIAEKAFTGEDHTTDLNGHGTHVAGTAAGTKAAGGSYDGVAPDAMLLNGKVLKDDGFGSTAGIVAGINWAVDPDGNPETDDGADIISMSLGGTYNNPYDPMSMAIKEAVETGVLVVVASGNCGACSLCGGYKGVTTPGTSPWAFTVGAVDKGNRVACFSGGGVIDAVGIKPDITAPGVGIKSSVPGGYSSYQGTSMATPHVSGAAALLLQKNPALNPEQISSILENTATDRGVTGKDTSYGAGTLNLSAAFRAKAVIKATSKISADMLIGEEINEEIIFYNFGSEPLYINVSHDGLIKFAGLPESPFQIEPTRNLTAKYRITASEVGAGTHNGKIGINTSDHGLPNASVSISIRIFESTAPKFEEVTFPALAFSREELELGTKITDNGVVGKVIAKIKSPENSFQQVEIGLEKLDEKRWRGLLKMPTVSSSNHAVLEVTATDNDGHASVFEKEMKITNLVVEIKDKDKATQGSMVEISTIFVNTADATKDVLAEFKIIDSLGITAFKSVDGSVTLPTGFKGSFAANWTPESYGNYVVNVTIKGASEEVMANSTESLTVTLPQWGSIKSVKLPETIAKGEVLSYEVQFGNSGPVPFEAIAALSVIDEHQKVKHVMPSEEKEVPAGGSTVFSASAEKLSLSGGNYTALLQVFYGNREEAVERPLKVTAPETLEITLGLAKKETEYRSENLRYTVTARNTGTMPLFAEFNATLHNSLGDEAYSARFNGSEVAAGESLEINSEINATELSVGNYLLLVNANYEGNSVNAQTQFDVRDTTPPLLGMITLPKAVRQYEPVVVELKALDNSPLANISAKLVTEEKKILGWSNASPARENPVIFNTAETGEHLLILEACDAYNNCNTSENAITVEECPSRKALVINARNDQRQIRPLIEETLSNNTCIYEYNTTNGVLPDSGYLANFAAVVWTSGNSPRAVPQHYQKLFLEYILKGGRLLVEGADIAFWHRNDEFMQNITHSILVETMTVSLPGSPEASPQEGKTINITRAAPHHITLALPETFSYQPPDKNRNPDEVFPLNDAEGLLKWGEGAGYAAVAYEAKAGELYKTAFLPLDIAGLNGETAKKILADATDWLLLESSLSDIGIEVTHGRLVEGNNEINLTIVEKIGPATTAEAALEVDGSKVHSQEIEMAGNSNTIQLTVPLTAGEHTLRATVIAPISEQDYNNNEVAYKAYVAPKLPDVVVKGITYTHEAAKKEVEINITTANIGGSAAETDILVFIGDNTTGTARLNLQAGEEVNYSFKGGAAIGKKKITAKAENSEDANYANNQLTIEANFCSKERILVVDDNDAESYATSNPSTAPEIARILDENGYCTELWGEAEKEGLPTHLNTFPAVVWSAGDYLQAITSSEEAELLKGYRNGLLLEGSDVAADLAGRGNESLLREISGTAFASDILIPLTESRALQKKEHPILEGIGTLEIKGNNSPYPDAVEAIDAEVVAEWQSGNGTAAITAKTAAANEKSPYKTAYYAFSIDGITDQVVMERLVTNTVEWLLEKPNNPPLIQNLSDDVSGEISTVALKITMKEGQTKNFSVIATDPDNDPLNYTWLLNGTVVSTTQNFTFSPRYNESGTYNLTIIVSDGQLETRAEFLLVVLDTMECSPGLQARLCGLQLGVCGGSFETCGSAGKWGWCSAQHYLTYNSSYEQVEATCDGFDNDCSGQSDEGFEDVDNDSLADCVDDDKDNDGVNDDEDDLIGNGNDINITGDDKDVKIEIDEDEDDNKTKTVRINNSNKPLLQFRYNFSKGSILLRNLSIEKQQNDSDKGFMVVKGLDLKGKRKQVFVDRLVTGSNAVCVKDEEVSQIGEVSGGCSGNSERLLKCEFPTTGPPYGRPGWRCGSGGSGITGTLSEGEAKTYSLEGKEFTVTVDAVAENTVKFTINGEGTPALKEGDTHRLQEDWFSITIVNITTAEFSGGVRSVKFTLSYAQEPPPPDECEPLFCQYIKETSQYDVSGLRHSAVMEQCMDADLDTYLPIGCAGGFDCDDSNSSINPAAAELCNNVDDNCNMQIDENRVCNTAPALQSIGNKTAEEGMSLSFTITATDNEADNLTFNATGLPQGAEFSNATATFTWTPAFEQSGVYALAFNTSDGLAFDYELINITVSNTNRAPVITSAYGNVTVNETDTVLIAVTAADADGDSLIFSVNDSRFALLASTNDEANFSWQTGYEDVGFYVVLATVSDSELTASKEVLVTVHNVNRPPRITSSIGNKTVNENETLSFFVKAVDDDNESLRWSVEADASGIKLDRDTGNFSWTPTFDQAGNYTVTFVVSDWSLSAFESINVTVINVNRPPVIQMILVEPLGLEMGEGESKTFTVFAYDNDGNGLVITWRFDDKVALVSNHTYTYASDYNSSGNHTLEVSVSDGKVNASQTMMLTVLDTQDCVPSSLGEKQCGSTDVGLCEFGLQSRMCGEGFKWLEWSDCTGSIGPKPEACNGLDDDCDGKVDERERCGKYGDVNMDGKVTKADARLIVNYSREQANLTKKQLRRADVTGNGKVNIKDARTISMYLHHYLLTFPVCLKGGTRELKDVKCKKLVHLEADVDMDGAVNHKDLEIAAAEMNSASPSPLADLNDDGVIDIMDMALIGKNFGHDPAQTEDEDANIDTNINKEGEVDEPIPDEGQELRELENETE